MVNLRSSIYLYFMSEKEWNIRADERKLKKVEARIFFCCIILKLLDREWIVHFNELNFAEKKKKIKQQHTSGSTAFKMKVDYARKLKWFIQSVKMNEVAHKINKWKFKVLNSFFVGVEFKSSKESAINHSFIRCWFFFRLINKVVYWTLLKVQIKLFQVKN